MKITYAYIETTTYCNLACKFCNREDVIDNVQHMSLPQFEVVLKQLKQHNITEAKLLGLGEPFMHPDFHLIVKRFKETFPDAYLIAATNCQIKFNDNYRKAIPYIDMLYLSIDGDEKNYEEIRVGSKWPKLLEFLGHLNDFRKETNFKCLTPINYTICAENVYDIPAMMKLQADYDLADIRLNFVQSCTEGETTDALMNGFTQEQLDYLHQYKQYFKGKAEWDYKDCFWPKNGIYIKADGGVRVCCMNTSSPTIGNILHQPLPLIHSGKRFIEIQQGCATN